MTRGVIESNRLEPQTCAVCQLDIPPSRLCFDRIDGVLVPRHVDCPRQPQPARLSGSAT